MCHATAHSVPERRAIRRSSTQYRERCMILYLYSHFGCVSLMTYFLCPLSQSQMFESIIFMARIVSSMLSI